MKILTKSLLIPCFLLLTCVFHNGTAVAGMEDLNYKAEKQINIMDAWGTSSTDVFAVGNWGTIIHYDGNTWSEMDSGTTNTYEGVWGTSSTDVFVVNGTTILHYDGTGWIEIDRDTGKFIHDI